MEVDTALVVVGAAITHGDINKFMFWLQFLAGERERKAAGYFEAVISKH